MAKPDAKVRLAIAVTYSPAARQVRQWKIEVDAGCTVSGALVASVYVDFPDMRDPRPAVGIWGRKCGLHHVLADGDRVEVYRGLQVDPKAARRERFKKQGAKTAGLFAARRAGAKAGY